ncbi:MAG: histidine kinase [Beijerinckiaceae bacterium]|nr:histidine kinase [Beijerinckiaceae bacterium]
MLDECGCGLWGFPYDEGLTFEDLSSRIHPADLDRVRAAFAATRAIVGAYEIDFRVLVDAEVRWISARGQGSDAEILDRSMFGIFLDVTGRKQAEEGNELLAGEMSHRVQNLLSIATGLTRMTSRNAATTADMAQELTSRLTALGRAHDLIRPISGRQGTAALLGDLISLLLAPYDNLGAFSGRIRTAVPRMGIGENATTSLALVVHEMATNSLKYGALSAPAGLLDIACTIEDDFLTLVWTESGGPAVSVPTRSGFGSNLVRRAMAGFGGGADYEWSPDGLVARLRMRADRLAK